ncbi:MAG: S-layer homology domain-containing protein, partial [Acidimicrobiia bacterium]
PGQSYLIEVRAGDAAGNWSDPLSGVFRTLGGLKDIEGHLFYHDILWMWDQGITRGCNPPVNDLFCPDNAVTRETMAAFLVRALGLTENDHPGFNDVAPGSTFANDIAKLATAGITKGCNPPANDRFCPKDPVTRETMAAFLVRALGLTDNARSGFDDVSPRSTFASDIGRLATAEITKGCNPPANDHFCPAGVVTRGQLAAFLHRALR